MTMEKWDEMEKILKENQLQQLYENIQGKNDWQRNIREVIDDELRLWNNVEREQNDLVNTLQEYNKTALIT